MATAIDKNVLRLGWLLPLVIALGCGGTPALRDAGSTADVGTGSGRGEVAPLDQKKDLAVVDVPDASVDLAIAIDVAIDEGPTDVPISCMPACVAPQICTAEGQCETFCAQGQTNCPGKGCTDLAIDSANCGLCGKACPQGEFCSEGKCAKMCAQGETKCGQSCIKLDTNYGNCGLCAFTCHDAEACVARVCRCESPNLVCSAVCTNVINNRQNCGACGNRCNGDYVCNGRNCGCPGGRQSCPNKANTCVTNLNDCCNGGEFWCGNRCQNIVSDRNNCGGCGRSCPGVEVCSNRNCGCPSTQPKSCGNGVCIPNGQCCQGTKSCGGNVCVPNDQCCAGQKNCGGGRCIAGNQCCDDRPQCGSACCAAGLVCANNLCVAPVDCRVSAYGEWSVCSKECGPGTQSRHRTVITPPSNGGAACPPLDETRACMIKECPVPVDCRVEYPAFGPCSKECGGGTQSRTGVIVVQPANGGRPCPASLTETRDCNTNPCPVPVDCVAAFGPWSACTERCGGGTRTRMEMVVIPASMGGKACDLKTETEKCNTDPCEPPPGAGGSDGNGNGNGNGRGNQ